MSIRRATLFLAYFHAVLALSAVAFAQGNDTCETAQVITLPGANSSVAVTGTNQNATAGDPVASCWPFQADVWYTVVAPVSGNLRVDTCAPLQFVGLSIAIYRPGNPSAPCPLTTSDQVACRSQGCISGDPGLTVDETAGDTFYIRVSGDQASSRGDFVLNVSIDGAACVAPCIRRQPASVVARRPDDDISFVVVIEGGLQDYQWRRNGVPVTAGLQATGSFIQITQNLTNSTLRLADWSLNDEGDYDVVVTGPGGNTTSDIAHLSVPGTPPAGPVSVEPVLIPPQSNVVLGTITDFADPIISGDGRVVFEGDSSSGAWVGQWQEDVLTIVSRRLASVPGLLPGERLDGFVSGSTRASNVGVTYVGAIGSSMLLGNRGLWLWRDGTVDLVAREGQAAPGVSGAFIRSISSSTSSGANSLNNTGEVAFTARLTDANGATIAANSALFRWTPTAGASLILAAGGAAPGTSANVNFVRDPVAIDDDGNILFLIQLTGGGGDALYLSRPTGLELVLKTGDQAPGLATGTTITALIRPLHQRSDRSVFGAIVSTGGFSTFQRVGAGTPVVVATRGMAAPGGDPGATFVNTSPLAVSSSGALLISGVITANNCESICPDSGVWIVDAAGIRPVLVRGQAIPGFDTPGNLGTIAGATINSQNQVVMGGDINFNFGSPSGVIIGWTEDTGPFAIAGPGTQIEISPGLFRTVNGSFIGRRGDEALALNESTVAFQANFNNNSRGIFTGSFSQFVRGVFPCRADFNGDGLVFPDDLSEFITCFFLQVQFPGFCPLADFNGDGLVFPDDLSEYITTFFLAVQFGC